MTNLKRLTHFLLNRGFTIEQLKSGKLNLITLLYQLKITDKQIIFPCFNEDGDEIGGKIRNLDGSLVNGLKSLSIKGMKTGLLYDKTDIQLADKVILVEGETDYMVLKILGFTGLIANLGGVASNINRILSICRSKEIVSFYDNDTAGHNANIMIVKQGCRLIKTVRFPAIEGISDINDLLISGYTYKDFNGMINDSIYINGEGVETTHCRKSYTDLISKYWTPKSSVLYQPFNVKGAIKSQVDHNLNKKINWNGNLKGTDITEHDIARVKSIDMTTIIEGCGIAVEQGDKCICPFHTDTKASLKIHKDTNSFCCYVCGAAGDTIKFVELHKGIGFIDIIKQLK